MTLVYSIHTVMMSCQTNINSEFYWFLKGNNSGTKQKEQFILGGNFPKTPDVIKNKQFIPFELLLLSIISLFFFYEDTFF